MDYNNYDEIPFGMIGIDSEEVKRLSKEWVKQFLNTYELKFEQVKPCCEYNGFKLFKANVYDWYLYESGIRNKQEMLDLLHTHRKRAIKISSDRRRKNYYNTNCFKEFLSDRYSLEFFNAKIKEHELEYKKEPKLDNDSKKSSNEEQSISDEKAILENNNDKSNTANSQDEEVRYVVLALFYYYLWKKKVTDVFDKGKQAGYKTIVNKHNFKSWKYFQRKYLLIEDKNYRLDISNECNLLKAIDLLKDYPESLSIARDELNTLRAKYK